MKRLLSALGSLLIISSSSSTVVSCGEKPMPSLSQNKIGDGLGYDIAKWDSSVLASDDFKSNFLTNLNDSFSGKFNKSNYFNMLLVDSNGNNEVAELLAKYESKASKDINETGINYESIINSLDFALYDVNGENEVQLAKWDSGTKQWEVNGTSPAKDITIKSVEDKNGAYKTQKVNTVSVKLEITPKTDNSLKFVGARINAKTNDDMAKYYTSQIQNADESTKEQTAFYNTANKNFIVTKDSEFDYRYAVSFYFSAS